MTDDPIAAILAGLREKMITAANVLTPGLSPEKALAAGGLHGSALKALDALDAALVLHRPRPAYGRLVCGHDTDAGGGTLLVTWPCQTHEAVLAALTGKGGDGAEAD